MIVSDQQLGRFGSGDQCSLTSVMRTHVNTHMCRACILTHTHRHHVLSSCVILCMSLSLYPSSHDLCMLLHFSVTHIISHGILLPHFVSFFFIFCSFSSFFLSLPSLYSPIISHALLSGLGFSVSVWQSK